MTVVRTAQLAAQLGEPRREQCETTTMGHGASGLGLSMPPMGANCVEDIQC